MLHGGFLDPWRAQVSVSFIPNATWVSEPLFFRAKWAKSLEGSEKDKHQAQMFSRVEQTVTY